MNRKQTLRLGTASFAVSFSILTTLPSVAAIDPIWDLGDVVMGFQSSTATATVLELNLGARSLYRDATVSFLIGNINPQLTSLFGNEWYNDPNLFFGVSGSHSNGSLGAGTANDGDFNSTIYASRARNGNGTLGLENSVPWNLTTGNVTSAASSMIQQGNTFNTFETNGIAAIATTNVNDWKDLNPVSGTNQTAAYTVLSGGIQGRFDAGLFDGGNFGGLSNVEGVVDFYRVVRYTNGGGNPGVGSYEGSFVVEQDGDVYYVVPEPGSASLLGLGVATYLGLRRRRRSAAN